MKRRFRNALYLMSLVCVIVFVPKMLVIAATTQITLQTNEYEIENEEKIIVTVRLNSDTNIGAYFVELMYDDYRLQYIGGGDNNYDGKVILEGTGYGNDIIYKLSFKAISGGIAEIECVGVDIRVEGAEGAEKQAVSNKGNLIINIVGEDTVVQEVNKEKYGIELGIPLCGVVDIDENIRYYIVDHKRYVPDIAKWDYTKVIDKYGDTTYTFLTNVSNEVRMLYLVDSSGKYYLYAYSKQTQSLYPCVEQIVDGDMHYVMSANVCVNWPEELTLAHVKREYICYAMDEEGECNFYRYLDGELLKWNEEDGKAFMEEQMKVFYVILVGTGLAVAVVCMILGISAYKKRQAKRAGLGNIQLQEHGGDDEYNGLIEFIDACQEIQNVKKDEQIKALKNSELYDATIVDRNDERKEKAVISVRNVSMKFNVSTSHASGIKEYIIQKIKKQVTYREFTALDNITFDIYKGEIVGIIGTNGSGKSTLLRIVSGALRPSEGKVRVNKRKLQLLTLGTGFDMELTARENIYLNGAMIGYTEEFIKENFDKILEFAELEEFVDEKVKNFSSGMVSRLGFAIATIGETSEILILDEILSVGDEFFRKKSLQKVKEMIHGGSTVLMVSHSMGTIIENCTKVIWIEKGKLKMIGEPRTVCKAYNIQYDNGKKRSKGVTGLTSTNYGWVYLKEGKLDTSYTGIAKNQYGWWYVKEGKLDWTYTGMVKNEYGWWYISKGRLDFTYTGMAKNEYGWWYISKGKLDFTYTGVAENAYGMWYMKNGKLDKTYTGKIMYNGIEYNVSKGVVDKLNTK